MDFSVIIPLFNSAKFVERAILSVVDQQQHPFSVEIVLVDDGSTDDTVGVVTQLAEHHANLRLFRLAENGGPGVARNKGILEARGEWVFFLDSDDTCKADFFAKLNACIPREENDIELVCFDWQYDAASSSAITGYEGRDDLALVAGNDKTRIIQEYLLNRVDSSVIYAVYKRRLLRSKNLLFRPGYHEDVDFMLFALLETHRIHTIEAPLYVKNNMIGSIVNTLTDKHIEGYLAALQAIYDYLEQKSCYQDYAEWFLSGVINVVASRIVRLLRFDITEAAQFALLQTLYRSTAELFQHMACSPPAMDDMPAFATKYQMVFDFFWRQMQDEAITSVLPISKFVGDVMDKSWSCYDLQHSVFLAPDEIRTCCKRYFYEGEMKGDVVLLAGGDDQVAQIDYGKIVAAKRALHKEINRDNAPQCRGCPFLAFERWEKPLERGIKYLSLEYHSVCNMACQYCSETYYGGKKAVYDVDALVDTMAQGGALADTEYIVWGGGEPLLDKSFAALLTQIAQTAPAVKQRVITNATRFSPELAELMEQDKAYIVTSIDAGSAATFNSVRRYNRMHKVMENLQRYAERAPENVIVKYIMLPENSAFEELDSFVSLMGSYGLKSCNFQISYDFKKERISAPELFKIATLYGLLLSSNVRFIFLDDLVWQRLTPLRLNDFKALKQQLSAIGLHGVLAEIMPMTKVAVWGTGAQTRLLLEKSLLLQQAEVEFFVDPRPDQVGRKLLGKSIQSPEFLRSNPYPLVIAAVQSAPHIYSQFLRLGLAPSRVVKQLIL